MNNFEKVSFFFPFPSLSSLCRWSHLGRTRLYPMHIACGLAARRTVRSATVPVFDIRANVFHSQTGNSSTHTHRAGHIRFLSAVPWENVAMLSLLLCAASASATTAQSNTAKSNILFLFADEMDGRILDPDSPQTKPPLPNLNRLVKDCPCVHLPTCITSLWREHTQQQQQCETAIALLIACAILMMACAGWLTMVLFSPGPIRNRRSACHHGQP